MSTIVKAVLSGQGVAANLASINVSATTVTSTMVHTGQTGTSSFDQVFVYAVNSSTNAVTLNVTVTYSSTANAMQFEIPAKGNLPELILPGILVPPASAAAGGIKIECGASTSNVISLYGEVNRITQ